MTGQIRLRRGLTQWAVVCLSGAVLSAGGCASRPSGRTTDAGISATMKNGRLAFSQGQYTVAAQVYEDAFRRASLLDDAVGAGDSAYNLAACYLALGRHDEAHRYLRESRAELARAGGAGIAEAWLLEARLARAENKPAEAEASLAKALEALPSDQRRHSDLAAEIHLVRAVMACASQNAEQARAALDAARAAGAEDSTSPAVRARAALARGHLKSLEHDLAGAAHDFDAAADAFREQKQAAEMARALVLAGERYAATEQFPQAGDRYYRAARSLYAQGLVTPALEQVKAALMSLERSGDEDLLARTQVLLRSIEESVNKNASVKD